MPRNAPVSPTSSVGSVWSVLRRKARSVLRAAEARVGDRLPPSTRRVLRLRLYPMPDRRCGTCAAFVPDRGEAVLAETAPAFREVTKWVTPEALAVGETGPLAGNAQRAWRCLGECYRDPNESLLVHPGAPDCGSWR